MPIRMTCIQEDDRSHGTVRDEQVLNGGVLHSDEVRHEVSNDQRHGNSHLRGVVGSSQLDGGNSEGQLDDEGQNELESGARIHVACCAQDNQQDQVLHKPKAPNLLRQGDMGHALRGSGDHLRKVAVQRLRKSLADGDSDDLGDGVSGPCIRGYSQRDQLPRLQQQQVLLRIKISF